MSDFDRDHLPAAGWASYRKVRTTAMAPVAGPFTVTTKEGEYELPAGWQGFIALDADGYPYPIDADVAARSYERVA